MGVQGQDLCKDIGNIVAGGNKLELYELVGNLLAQPDHLDTEVAVAPGNDMVVNHGHACLVVLEEQRRLRLGKTKLLEEITQPDNVLGRFSGGDVFGLGGAKADGSRSLCESVNQAAGKVDGVAVPRALAGLVAVGCIRIGRDDGRANTTLVHEGQGRGSKKVS